MKIYIAKCDRFGEEVPLSKWENGGPWYYKEFWVWMLNKPTIDENNQFTWIGEKSMSEDELSTLFFLNRKDWIYWAGKELHKIREIKNYISELDLYAEF